MRSLLSRFLATLCCLVFAGLVTADDFKSTVIQGADGTVSLTHVPGDRFLVIRNFTQDGVGSGTRGFVTVSPPLQSGVNVLAAAIIDPNSSSVDVINNIVIAGPASVTVTCDPSATCFITYRKDPN